MTKKKSVGNKAAEFFRNAAAALRGKAGALRARILFLASLRRRAAVVAGLSRQIRALSSQGHQRRGGNNKDHQKTAANRAAVVRLSPADDVVAVGMAELASLFREVDGDDDDNGGRHYQQDWALALRSLFNNDHEEDQGNRGYYGDDDLDGVEEGLTNSEDDDDEASVIDLIRSRREGEGREFKIDDEIDRAAGMFITRVRRRQMRAQHYSQAWRSSGGFR